MSFETFSGYIVLLVLAICLCIGYILKHAIKTDKINPYIPLIMGVLGVILNVWINGFAFTPEIVLGGLISGLASTGTHETINNLIKEARGEK